MKRFKQKLIVGFVFLFALNSLYSYAANKEPTDIIDTKAEIWELQMTGQTKGTLKMVLKPVQTEKDICTIKGEFSGRIKDHLGGIGNVRCKLKGKIEQDNLLADFRGPADMQRTNVFVKGTMRGTVSKFQGSGSYRLRHAIGSSSGKWTIKKIRISK